MKLLITDLKLPALIGIHEWEQQKTRFLTLNLELKYQGQQAAAEDNFKHALDYTAVEEFLLALLQSKPWQLIETVADIVATELLKQFPVLDCVRVRVDKPYALRFAASVAAEVSRSRAELA